MAESDVFQTDRFGYSLSDLDFFSDTVYQMKLYFREQDRKWYAGKTASRTDIHNCRSFSEFQHFQDT